MKNTNKIKKVNDLINEIIEWKRILKNKDLVLNHLYLRLNQLEND